MATVKAGKTDRRLVFCTFTNNISQQPTKEV